MIWITRVEQVERIENKLSTQVKEPTQKKPERTDDTIFQQILDVAMKKISTQPPIV